MSDPYLGEIRIFAGNFAPQGWLLCQGQLLSIAENQALFQLIGTTYGGDGQSKFALPNLASRVPVHSGTNANVAYPLGQTGGAEQVTVTVPQLPAHTHSLATVGSPGTTATPASGTTLSDMGPAGTAGPPIYGAYSAGNTTALNPQSISSAGGNQPHDNIQPYLAINFIICTNGFYPPQNN